MNLKHLTDDVLLKDIQCLVRQEQKLTATILWHLKEIDDRKLYSEAKCSSLFDYCVKVLGYSEGAAYRRVIAARALKTLPQLAIKIENGSLSLMNLALIESEFNEALPEEKEKLFEQVSGKSTREAEEFVRETKQRPKTYTVTMNEETFRAWQELRQLGVDLRRVVETAKRTKLNSTTKKEVFARDEKCQQCGTKHRLEFDHRRPKALGGSDTIENLRLLCRNCNQRKRIGAGLLQR